MTRQRLLGWIFWACMAGLWMLVILLSNHDDPAKTKHARAQGFERWHEQVLHYSDEVQNGKRLDRADPWLPALESEAEEARRLNYERCQVAIEQRLASGQIKQLRYDDPRKLFALVIDGQRWREDPDITVLEEAACVFSAGEVRHGIFFPVLDEQGQQIGRWGGIKFIAN